MKHRIKFRGMEQERREADWDFFVNRFLVTPSARNSRVTCSRSLVVTTSKV